MKKKELKQRIKELETENLMLRVMALNPVYIYLYNPLPYNPYWQPYRYLPQPIWYVDYAHPQVTNVGNGGWMPASGTTEIIGDVQIVGSTTVCIDYPLDSATLGSEITNRLTSKGLS